MKKQIFGAILISSAIATATMKTQISLNTTQSKSTLILLDEKLDEACVVNGTGRNACTNNENAQALALNQLPRENPKYAGLGAILVDYYLVCTAVQFLPEIADAIDGQVNKRSTAEKVKDFFAPSQERQDINSTISEIKGFSNTVSGTICLPVATANTKLIEIKNR